MHLTVAATAIAFASQVGADLIHWDVNLVVPNNIDGLYINVETRTTGSAASVVPGWDLNPYGTSTTAMTWFGATGGGCVTGTGQGGTTIAVASLSSGTIVGAGSTFGNTTSSVTAGGWLLNANNYFGFRFVGADGATRYGFGVMAIGATMGARTLLSITFESTPGVAIAVGGCTPVTWYRDLDGDGVGLAADGTTVGCAQPSGYAATNGDNCPGIPNPNQEDVNGNGLGDACELAYGDLNLDGVVNASDVPLFFNTWGSNGANGGDLNRDGIVNAADFSILLANWGTAP